MRSPAVRAPSCPEICVAPETISSLSSPRRAPTRSAGPEALTAATTAPLWSNTGAATQRMPSSFSTSSRLKPRSRMRRRSSASCRAVTSVRGVCAGRPAATTRSNSAAGRWASSAFPDAVEWTSARSPTREAIWMVDEPLILST